MVDIQSGGLRLGRKKEEEERRRKIETTMVKCNARICYAGRP